MPDSTAHTADTPEISAPPFHQKGLHFITGRERYDRVGSRRGGSRLRFTVYDGTRLLYTYHDRRLAERHVSGKGVVLERKGLGYHVWKGAVCERFDTLKEAQAFARGKEVRP